ncbi:Gamma-aminobutyric acid receptor alpha-like [Eufriesea mexicana]|uniref:Gamma-aminobutyric acid receptor alpha-like n=1 Tax=Eufriesea mexicana TaxID=516756 RepID=A0A310SL73_9HYME|nr:Gamma-aminobutyric acid receptor alpha-like [Eufriesea mexicana]
MKLLVSTRGPCWAVAGQDRHFASQPHGVELNHPCGLTVDGTSPSASMCPSPSRVRLRQRTAPSRAATGAKTSTRQRTQSNNHSNISELLDNLLRGYDNSVRPDFGGPPATVEVDIMVRSMGPISEVDMTYSMDCYFRQSWVDRRLAFQSGKETLALSISMLARIWKPDTYFYNGKHSYLHTITSPNKFVRLYQDGRVLYSSRLTIKAGCPMNLENFPMDTQRCPLQFGSFGYTKRDVIYKWNSDRQVAIADDMKLSQFDLVANPTANYSASATLSHGSSARKRRREEEEEEEERRKKRKRRLWMGKQGLEDEEKMQGFHVESWQREKRRLIAASSCIELLPLVFPSADNERRGKTSSEYSMLLVYFHLQRHMGNFLIQVYGPCVLLVVLSWVSFWLNREATADRVSLGITTVLTMTFLGLEARTDLPKVPYPTALDFFVFLSFAFIFATIIQFAVVHYFTKYGSGECYFSSDLSESETSSDEEETDTRPLKKEPKFAPFLQARHLSMKNNETVGGELIYTGSLTSRVRNLKLVSIITSILTSFGQPIIFSKIIIDDNLIGIAALFAVINLVSIGTPIFVHLLTRRYVITMYKSQNEKYIAKVYSFLGRQKQIQRAGSVRQLELAGRLLAGGSGRLPIAKWGDLDFGSRHTDARTTSEEENERYVSRSLVYEMFRETSSELCSVCSQTWGDYGD